MTHKIKSELEDYLRGNLNSRSREVFLNYRIYFDLKLAAARRNYDLRIYVPEVDRDGFDIMLDDDDSVRHVQLKTVLKDAQTSEWLIHKRLLRPSLVNCEKLEFESSPSGTGLEGGILIVEIGVQNQNLQVNYLYTDIFVIRTFQLKLIDKKTSIQTSTLQKILQRLKNGKSTERIKIPRSLFVRPRDTDALLCLMGLHSICQSNWRGQLLKLAEQYCDQTNNQFVAPKAVFVEEFSSLVT